MTDCLTILCGGASKRMGQDKALLLLDNESLLLRHVRMAQAAGFRVQIAAAAADYADLPADIVRVQDRLPERAGPLSALAGALQALAVCGGQGTYLMPVDTLLTAAQLRALLTEAQPAPWITIAERGQLHNVFAYAEVGLLPRIEQWLAAGIRALQPLNSVQGAKLVAMPAEWSPLLGFNTPEEWQQAKEYYERI